MCTTDSCVPFDSKARIIEVGAHDREIAQYLWARDRRRYLGLVDSSLPQPENGAGEMSAHFHPYTHPRQIARNNADVLIFSGRTVRHLWSFRTYQHAEFVAWTPGLNGDTVIAILGLLRSLWRGAVKLSSIDKWELSSGRTRTMVLLRIIERLPARKRYISPILGIDGFFRKIGSLQLRYAILRWFDELPANPRGSDIDVLIADEDLRVFDELASELPGTTPCDLYTVSGLPRSDYLTAAYFPPSLSREILDRRVRWKEDYYVPALREHFISLAFHAIYHKGGQSGIPTVGGEQSTEPHSSHDYAAVLQRMAESLGIHVKITLEDLDDYLQATGWAPPHEVLVQLAEKNDWLRRRIAARSRIGNSGKEPVATAA